MPRRPIDEDDEQVVIIEQESGSNLSAFLLGAALGAGLALLLAPQSGADTRRTLRTQARRAGEAGKRAAEGIGSALTQARSEIEARLESAKDALDLKKVQVSRAMEAGRAAAQQAREDLERRIADQRAQAETRSREHDPAEPPDEDGV